MSTVRRLAAALLTAASLAFAAIQPGLAQETCLSNVDLPAAIARGDIPPVAQVLERNGIGRNTEVLSVEACRSDGGWAYHVGVIDASGKARTLVLRASG
jgi:hypothetical protein